MSQLRQSMHPSLETYVPWFLKQSWQRPHKGQRPSQGWVPGPCQWPFWSLLGSPQLPGLPLIHLTLISSGVHWEHWHWRHLPVIGTGSSTEQVEVTEQLP